jgi:hypothetical protein
MSIEREKMLAGEFYDAGAPELVAAGSVPVSHSRDINIR